MPTPVPQWFRVHVTLSRCAAVIWIGALLMPLVALMSLRFFFDQRMKERKKRKEKKEKKKHTLKGEKSTTAAAEASSASASALS
jgi:hypothetical protein